MPSTFLRCSLGIALAITLTPLSAKPLPPVNFSGCALDKTLFFSYTKDRKQAVEVCEVKEGYRYTFGQFTVVETEKKSNKLSAEYKKLNLVSKGGIQIVLHPGEIGRIYRDVEAGFALKQGGTYTWLEADTVGNVNLVTAEGGSDGWKSTKNREAIQLDATGWGYINEIERYDMPYFTYDNTGTDSE